MTRKGDLERENAKLRDDLAKVTSRMIEKETRERTIPNIRDEAVPVSVEAAKKVLDSVRSRTRSTDSFADAKCPIGSESHSDHDKAILNARTEVRLATELQQKAEVRALQLVQKAAERIKQLEASQVVIPDSEKDRTSQVLAQRVYELQRQNEFLRKRLSSVGAKSKVDGSEAGESEI